MQAAQFLMRHQMHPDCIDLHRCAQEAVGDMRAGLAGRPVSFEMLPCYVSLQQLAKPEKANVLVLDAGGTNLRLSCVHYGEQPEPEIRLLLRCQMPGVQEPVDVQELFAEIARKTAPYLRDGTHIGFCFSYAMDMQKNQDGRIRFICKSIHIQNAEGVLVGQSLNHALLSACGRGAQIAVVNDSVAVTLAARCSAPQYSAYLGLIVGTGFNICYAEHTQNIAAAGDWHAPDMLINMESDKFFKMTRGTFDFQYDETGEDLEHPTMKMLTGAYLGGLCYLTFLGCAEEQMVSEPCAEALRGLGTLTTEQLCAFLTQPDSQGTLAACCFTAEDAAVLREIALLLIERASKLVAAITVAAVRRSYRYRENAPACICIEGSTILKVPTMREQLCAYLHEELDADGEAFELISVENATVRGTAVAVQGRS